MAAGWPVTLNDGRVGLRPPRMREAGAWSELRIRDREWLQPWEGRPPYAPEVSWEELNSPGAYAVGLRLWRREARAGRALPFAITYDGELVGHLNLNSIVLGAFRCARAGYWVASHVAGQGVMPTALALAVDHCFDELGLHRIEVNIRPENTKSRRVVEKLGLRQEGLHERFLFIDGDWRDHLQFAVTAEEVPEGMLRRWHAARAV